MENSFNRFGNLDEVYGRFWIGADQSEYPQGANDKLAGCHPADSVANHATPTSDPVQFRVALPAANPSDNQKPILVGSPC